MLFTINKLIENVFYLRTKIAIRMNLKIRKNQQLRSTTKF